MIKKTICIVLCTLGLPSSIATQNTSTPTLIGMSLILAQHIKYSKHYTNSTSSLILNHYLRKIPIQVFPSTLKNIIQNFTHEWMIYALEEKGIQHNLNTHISNWNIKSMYLNKKQINPHTFKTFTNYASIALHSACKQQIPYIDIAPLLYSNLKLDVNLKDSYNYTPLIWCCKHGDATLAIATWLLQHPSISVNMKGYKGDTPLLCCCYKENISLAIAKVLLNHPETNVNAKNDKGHTPLLWCCKKGIQSLGIINLLLQHPNINVDLQDNYGNTPLDVILHKVQSKKQSCVYIKLWHLLIDKEAKLNNYQKEYLNLNPNNFPEPQKSHLLILKNNPPFNLL